MLLEYLYGLQDIISSKRFNEKDIKAIIQCNKIILDIFDKKNKYIKQLGGNNDQTLQELITEINNLTQQEKSQNDKMLNMIEANNQILNSLSELLKQDNEQLKQLKQQIEELKQKLISFNE